MRYLHELFTAAEPAADPFVDTTAGAAAGLAADFAAEVLAEPMGGSKRILLKEDSFVVPGYAFDMRRKKRIHVLALGDVGSTLCLAMKLTGADILSAIGICDIDPKVTRRFEHELNQICPPGGTSGMPPVEVVPRERLFDCDVFVFCASLGVPDLKEKDEDVRMVQLERNAGLIAEYAAEAADKGFNGEFFVVSDPVDPLCAAAAKAGQPLHRIQGFGLGVMNGRAAYYAARDPLLRRYLEGGRVFGPHGEDLVVADSVTHYDHRKSLRLTELTVKANLEVREIGYKPYIAPAVSSGALSILANLRGDWHYSSAWFGKAFLGMRNRRTAEGLEVEDLPLDEALFGRIAKAYEHLGEIDMRL